MWPHCRFTISKFYCRFRTQEQTFLQDVENIIACQKLFPTCLASQIDLMVNYTMFLSVSGMMQGKVTPESVSEVLTDVLLYGGIMHHVTLNGIIYRVVRLLNYFS